MMNILHRVCARAGFMRGVAAVALLAGPAVCRASFAIYGSASTSDFHWHYAYGYSYYDDTANQNADQGSNYGTYSAAANWQDSSSPTINGVTVPWAANMSATAYATVDPGTLHLYAGVHSMLNASSFQYYDSDGNAQIVMNPLSAGSQASASGEIIDRIVVTSATLAPGTPVSFRMNITLHDDVHDTRSTYLNEGGAGAQVWGTLNLSGTVRTDGIAGMVDNSGDGTGLEFEGDMVDHTGQLTSYGNPTAVFHTTVGAQFTFDLTVAAQAGAWANADNPDLLAVADAGDTVYFNVDPITAGAAYTTDSGFSYVTPAPEPGMAGMWLGVVGVGLIRRRRVVARG